MKLMYSLFLDRFIEGWSHGFTLMLTLLPEVKIYLGLMSDWISEAFAKDARNATRPSAHLGRAYDGGEPWSPSVETGGGGGEQQQSRKTRTGGTDVDREDDDVLSFTTRKRPGSSQTLLAPGLGLLNDGAKPPSTPAGRYSIASLDVHPDEDDDDDNDSGPSSPSPKSKQQPPTPPDVDASANYFDNSMSSPSPLPATGGSSSSSAIGIGGGNNGDVQNFLDAKALLQRRREEAVFGLDGGKANGGNNNRDDKKH
jgi:hypothetical protein